MKDKGKELPNAQYVPPLRAHDTHQADVPSLDGAYYRQIDRLLSQADKEMLRSLGKRIEHELAEPTPFKSDMAAVIPRYGPQDEQFWGQPETDTPRDTPSFDAFVGEIKALFGKALRKGYKQGAALPDDPNPLYEFMRQFFSDDHALGEIVYKAIRFKNKRDPEDLVKIAGWAWLIYMHHWQEESRRGN